MLFLLHITADTGMGFDIGETASGTEDKDDLEVFRVGAYRNLDFNLQDVFKMTYAGSVKPWEAASGGSICSSADKRQAGR